MNHHSSMSIVYLALSSLVIGCEGDRSLQTSTAEVRMAQQNNHIDYVEFTAEDLEAVKAFYGGVFKWEFQDWGPDYISFSGAGIDGGFTGGKKPVLGSTLVILYADDLEATEKRVVEAGGEITERHEFPGGRRFHFRDPSGNVLGVWTMVEGESE